MDIDHQTYLALWALRHIVTLDAAVSEPVAAFAQTLSKELDEHDPAESPRVLFDSQTFAALDELLQDHQADARACFANDYEMVELLVRGHRALREYYMLPELEQNLTDMRDEYMARVFDVLDRGSQGRVYFGQFGSAHVQGAPTGDYANAEGYASFAMCLAGEDSTACGSVCLLLYAHYDGERDMFRSISSDFQERLSPWKGEDVLIDLAAPNSPFDNAVVVFENGDISASTCYQQLVLLSNMNMVSTLPQ